LKTSTKDRIIEASREYFNQHGFGGSTLYKLSQSMGISRGNLTYHFKDKEELFTIHLEELVEKSTKSFTNSFLIPSWETLRSTSKDFMQVQKDYSYIFFDRQMLFRDEVLEKIKAIREKHISIQMSMIHVSIESGNMKSESMPGLYLNSSRVIWKILFFHLVDHRFSNDQTISWDKLMWSLLLPHFTKKGIRSFQDHFGIEYFESLGMSYDSYMKDQVSF